MAEKYVAEQWELIVRGGVKAGLGTTLTDLFVDTVPDGYNALVKTIAVDNTVSGQVDVKIEGKSALKELIRTESFPADLRDVEFWIKVPSRSKYSVQAKAMSGTIDLKWRVSILLVKK